MEQRLIAVPSIALSISVLALGATIGSGSCRSAALIRLGFGLNLSTLAPFLTLAWHAFSLVSPYTAPAAAAHDSYYYRPLSDSSSAVTTGEDHRPSTATAIQTRVRVWVPRTLALLWLLNTLLVFFVARWSSAIAFSYAGLALLSTFEAGVLALGGMLAQSQIQRELAGETDNTECRWENDQGDDHDDMKHGEILPA